MRRTARKDPFIKIGDADPETLGPAMQALTEQQRRWVLAYAMCGEATAAARSAGYSDKGSTARVKGFHNLRNPKIIAALKEWTTGALEGRGAFVAVQALIEIASDPKHSKRLAAADSLADRVGFARQANVSMTVEHTDNRSTASLMDAVKQYFQPRAPIVIEAKFEEADAASES